MNLSPNFTLEEMIVSQEASRLGLKNVPSVVQTAALRALCEKILEPLRFAARRSVHISSGYRNPLVNSKIGGAANSQHCLGEAADIFIPGMSVPNLIEFIQKQDLPFDQLINEFGSWVHVSHVAARKNRGEILTARFEDGRAVYRMMA